jgi:site-specific DNA recombinase
MQAFIYCRVSSDEQASDNHYSLDNQEQKARDYCKLKDWRIVDARKDVASGKNSDREGYKDLISSIKSGQTDCVVVYRLDRLSRNVRDIYDFLDLIKRHEVAFVSLSEGFDTTTAMGRAMLGVAAVFAQLTREKIAENVRDGLMRRAQAGLYNGGKNPFGYKYSKELRTLVPVPEEAEIVRHVYSLFLDRRWGGDKIARYLNEENICSKFKLQWNRPQVQRILKSTIYAGKVQWHGEIIEGKHEPIVSEEMYRAAQEVHLTRGSYPNRSQQSQHLLSGIAQCGYCGKKLVAHYGTPKADGTRHLSYTHNKSVKRGGCQAFYKAASKLETAVIAEIWKMAESDLLGKVASEELHKQMAAKASPLKGRRETIISELSGMKEKFNGWADRLDRGLIDEDQFRQQNSRLLSRKQALQVELEGIDRELAGCEDVEVSFEAAKAALSQFPTVWANLEMEERRDLVRSLVEKLGVHRERAVLKLLFLPEMSVAI